MFKSIGQYLQCQYLSHCCGANWRLEEFIRGLQSYFIKTLSTFIRRQNDQWEFLPPEGGTSITAVTGITCHHRKPCWTRIKSQSWSHHIMYNSLYATKMMITNHCVHETSPIVSQSNEKKTVKRPSHYWPSQPFKMEPCADFRRTQLLTKCSLASI